MSKFSEDIARYKSKGYHGRQLWLNPAVWAIATHRLGNWLYVDKPTALVALPLKIVFFFANLFCEVVMEMHIDALATIGPGLYIAHIGGVHINPAAVLGRDCDIAHRVTIGASAMGRQGIPVLGDDVYVGTGATLVGKIRVGSGAKIAANTLVITNVPEGATMMGVPGRIIMRPPKAPQAPATVAAEKTDAQ
ncbi:serine acetyltransferase [Edaphobacter sp.]|uniref:serine O-acetyltransferase n=1 Tax=Edaphobacter sp. TaxID=1934404 RepID=UPI002DBB5221|nr:serine acetyltransferase [Edaphobacter sp.]HEU5340238.1 serine acetyltransferase [Edaphobacter sp.]